MARAGARWSGSLRSRRLETVPIRWVCGLCLKVVRQCLKAYRLPVGGNALRGHYDYVTTVAWPQCCGLDLLLAGEPKRDVHGLREKDAMIDPVDNLIGMVA